MTRWNKTFAAATGTMLAIAVAAGGGCERSDESKSASSPAAEDVTAKSAAPDPGTVPQPASPPAPATGPADVAGVAETPPPAPAPSPSPDAPAAAAGKRESAGGVSWETPPGWSRGPEAPMRLVTLTDGTAEIRISSFPGNVGGVLLNVNRWRNEVGLPPVASDAEAEKLMTDVDVAGRKIRVADMAAERARTIVASVPGEGKLYFFKMSGAPDVVAARKDAFDQLVKTIRVE